MDWLSNITVDATTALGVIVLAAVLTYRRRKPAMSAPHALRKKLKTVVKPISPTKLVSPVKNIAPGVRGPRLSPRLWSLLQWRPTFLPNIFSPTVIKKLAPAAASPAAAEVSAIANSEPLSRAQQWDCVTDVVTRAIEGASSVERWQQAAEDQLDAATYAINGLLDELLPVMPQSFGQTRQFAPVPVTASRPASTPVYHVADNENRPTAAKLALAAYGSVAA